MTTTNIATLSDRLRIAKHKARQLHCDTDAVIAAEQKARPDFDLMGTSAADKASFNRIDTASKAAKAADAAADELRTQLDREFDKQTATARTSTARHNEWATITAGRMTRHDPATSTAAIVTGPTEIPALIEPDVIALPENPSRLIDLMIERRELRDSVTFEYLKQIARTNNATAVADGDTKPTSVMTATPVEDRARVIAHLCEPLALRWLQDQPELIRFVWNDLGLGLLDQIEWQAISGDGVGENVVGITNTSGITDVPWNTAGLLATCRKALTAMHALHEEPTGWAFNPQDMEAIDLATDNDGAFHGDIEQRVFGGLPRVASTSVPAGTGLLADWRQTRLYVRQGMTLDADTSGDLFKKNQVQYRCEARVGFALLRPQAVCTVATTDPA